MRFSNIERLSNYKFEYLLSLVFIVIDIYLLNQKSFANSVIVLLMTFIYIIIIFLKTKFFLLIFTFWMRTTHFFNLYINPFYKSFITSCSMTSRILGYEQLKLELIYRKHNFVHRVINTLQNNFKEQF